MGLAVTWRSRAGAHFRRLGALGTACELAASASVAILLLVVGVLAARGWRVLDWGFLANPTSPDPTIAGVGPAFAATLWMGVVAGGTAVPAGVGCAVYLEEYAPRTRWTSLAKSALANLAGVPPVVYGVVGLALFVRGVGMGRSLLAGGLTLAVLALPLVIAAARRAIRAVPRDLREAAYGLGATRWQVIRHQVLPAAAPGIATGSCLALTRAVGEAAPLVVVGAVSLATFFPLRPADPLTSLPTRIFDWSARSDPQFGALAAGAALALLAALLTMNAAAALARARLERIGR